MAIIKPFKAIRPTNEYVKMISKSSYNTMNIGDEKEIFVRDEEEAIYIYREIIDNKNQIGIVASVSVDDNIGKLVEKHEYSNLDRQINKSNNIRCNKNNTCPVLLTYKDNKEIEDIINYYVYFMPPTYDFKTEDNITHTVWKVEKERDIKDLINEFKKVGSFYVEDENNISLEVEDMLLKEMDKKHNYTGDYYIAMIASDNTSKIRDYNKVVKYLNGFVE